MNRILNEPIFDESNVWWIKILMIKNYILWIIGLLIGQIEKYSMKYYSKIRIPDIIMDLLEFSLIRTLFKQLVDQ